MPNVILCMNNNDYTYSTLVSACINSTSVVYGNLTFV